MSSFTRLSEDEVLRIRRRLASIALARTSTFGAIDPIFPDRLASAVARQWTSNGQTLKYTRLSDIAATLFYGVAMSHAFENGNKRTAMMALFVILDRNRHILVETTETNLYQFAEAVADHRLTIPNNLKRDDNAEVLGVSRWIRTRMKPIPIGDRHMRFSELRSRLEALGCTFDKPYRNYVRIHRGPYTFKCGYPNRDFEIDVSQIKSIRRGLQLDAIHGVDGRGFYDIEARVDRFVEQHIELMHRLADL